MHTSSPRDGADVGVGRIKMTVSRVVSDELAFLRQVLTGASLPGRRLLPCVQQRSVLSAVS